MMTVIGICVYASTCRLLQVRLGNYHTYTHRSVRARWAPKCPSARPNPRFSSAHTPARCYSLILPSTTTPLVSIKMRNVFSESTSFKTLFPCLFFACPSLSNSLNLFVAPRKGSNLEEEEVVVVAPATTPSPLVFVFSNGGGGDVAFVVAITSTVAVTIIVRSVRPSLLSSTVSFPNWLTS